MVDRFVSVGDDFTLPPSVKAADGNLPAHAKDATLKATYATPEPELQIPLNVPTYDGNTNTTHPSVLYFKNSWNGYRYWMVHTPYPAADRENPSIVASDNGVEWVTPTGVTNPIIPASAAPPAGYTYHSDTHLTMMQDGVTMAMFFRMGNANATGKNAIYRTTSTDGWKTRTAHVKVLEDTASELTILSPAIEWDGTQYVMWAVNSVPAEGVLRRWTSPDSITWTGPTTCTFPAGINIWHIDVKRAGGVWHLLASTETTGPLWLFKSTDGITWTGSVTDPAILPSGLAFDYKYYRSCFLPRVGDPLRWDVWVCGIGGANSSTAPWRIGLLRDTPLPTRRADAAATELINSRLLAATGSLPYVAADNFNRTDSATSMGMATTGQTWTSGTGTAGIQGGKAYCPSGVTRQVVATPLSDVEVSVDITGTMGEFFLLPRYLDGSNWWRIGGHSSGSGNLTLEKFVGGAMTNVGTTLFASVPAPKLFVGDRLRIRAVGSTWTIYRNNELVLSFTDAFNQAATSHGIQLSANAVRLDNFGVKVAS